MELFSLRNMPSTLFVSEVGGGWDVSGTRLMLKEKQDGGRGRGERMTNRDTDFILLFLSSSSLTDFYYTVTQTTRKRKTYWTLLVGGFKEVGKRSPGGSEPISFREEICVRTQDNGPQGKVLK